MVRVTTESDVELQVLLLTDEGKRKLADGEELKPEDLWFNPDKKVEVRLKIDKSSDEPFIVHFNPDISTQINCYWETIGEELYALVVTIPSNTFKISGRLMISIATNEENINFADDDKRTVTEYEKTEVFYVMQ
jgi:hypothetical protein